MIRQRSTGSACSFVAASSGSPQPARPVALRTIRRLALAKQGLSGPRRPATRDGLLDLTRELRSLQLDPISVVARSHLLVLWSRLGAFDPALVDGLLFGERTLFEYLSTAAAVVLTEDFPLHRLHMRSWPGRGRLLLNSATTRRPTFIPPRSKSYWKRPAIASPCWNRPSVGKPKGFTAWKASARSTSFDEGSRGH